MQTRDQDLGADVLDQPQWVESALLQLEKWQQVIESSLALLQTGKFAQPALLVQRLSSPTDQQLLSMLMGVENLGEGDVPEQNRLSEPPTRPVSEYLTGQFVLGFPPESVAFAPVPIAMALQEVSLIQESFPIDGLPSIQELPQIEETIETHETIENSILTIGAAFRFADLPLAPRRRSRKRRRQLQRHSSHAASTDS
ncbi:hypothetical protein D2Q93_10180 [Alicyclobacillaceae bacterium I2511]|nr:hypothetical protein D2Q93_10180 [Alicyclobacillaceae bacterium I2511]